MGDDTQPRVIRDSAFAGRLAVACDGHSQVPEYNKGRLVWIRQQLQLRYNVSVSMETVRKWFGGEMRPRPDKMKMLAELLEVDEAWLSLGEQADMAPRERRARNALVDGAVNVVAGFIQMDGGVPAFPDEDDADAQGKHIDIFAIIRGARYNIHVASATQTKDGDVVRFSIPTNYESLFVVGVVRRGPLCVDAIELSADLISRNGVRKGGYIELDVRQGEKYLTQDGEAPRITGFDKRL